MRSNQFVPEASAYLLWQQQAGSYAPIRLSKTRIAVIFALIGFFLLTTLSLFAYLYFKDDVLATLVRRQQAQTLAYEDRIAKMRVQMDRISSRQLIDQEVFEKKVETLLDKQALMEERQEKLALLGSLPARPVDIDVTPKYLKPTPLSANGSGVFASLFGSRQAARNLTDKIGQIDASLSALDKSQTALLSVNQSALQAKNKEMARVMTEFGIQASSAQGGPYLPPNLPPHNATSLTPFDKMLDSIAVEKAKNQSFMRAIKALPLGRPLPASHELTSGFGTRVDPFRGTMALHSGQDFRAALGDAVKATAAGKVTLAGSNGGYGNMVEIEHEHGYSTRYAHLSAFDVSEGMSVLAGQIIGRAGSTGRSTGAHLHYEVRRDDEAQDPTRYLQAASRLEVLRIK